LPKTPPSLSDRTYPLDSHLLVLRGWCLLLLAAPLALWVGKRIHDKHDVPTWPTTQAEVQGSSLCHHTGRGTPGRCLRLAYRYQVGGTFYNSSGVDVPHLGHAGRNRSEAVMRERLARMGTGDRIEIHYHPRQRARSAAHFEPVDFGDYFFSAGAFGLFVTGAASIMQSKRLRRDEAVAEANRLRQLRQGRPGARGRIAMNALFPR